MRYCTLQTFERPNNMSSTTVPHTDSSAQVTGDGAATINYSPKTFLDLPKEIRLEIYDWVFYSTTLEADREVGIPVAMDPPRSGPKARPDIDQEDDEDEDDADNEPSSPGRAGSLFLTPIMLEKLNLVCKLMNEDIAQSWHGKVTYWFPCTVAFVDVLSQWSQSKLESVRHIHVLGFPLPLYPADDMFCYVTHFVNDALPIFPGLRLDVLTVENIWLYPDGAGNGRLVLRRDLLRGEESISKQWLEKAQLPFWHTGLPVATDARARPRSPEDEEGEGRRKLFVSYLRAAATALSHYLLRWAREPDRERHT